MFQQKLTEIAQKHEIPGMAAGILMGDQIVYASHGVTNLGNPQPVDEHTLFHLASITKTFTATALVRLAAAGRLDLSAPVRRYVPELRLADPGSTAEITVGQLLNHTAGLEWNLIDGEQATLDGFAAELDRLPIIAPPGTRASYSQAGYNLAGLVIEKVTGQPYEKVVADLALRPAGLERTCFGLDEVVRHRFAIGHTADGDGVPRPATPWAAWPAGMRANNPGGGIASSVSDLLRWARHHLGSADLHAMTEPTVPLRASTLGDAFGICWFLRDVGGVRTIGHGGSGNGQFAELLIVPSRDFAVVSLANAGPAGYPANQEVVGWALADRLGLREREVRPLAYDESRAREIAGRYELDAMDLEIATDGAGLTLAVGIKPAIRRASEADMPPDYPAATLGLLPDDEYVITDGGLAGQRGYVTRDAAGAVIGADLAGRLFRRIR
ncbi:serine hydrolase domain-containing protein [Actinoplanes oblitus]|uniref:Serine hydrolase domain-containing protein n=1 Tax=Actinoplanes oblitus TaxID=3040509 RepID=A0ABY8WDF1_9ACTN|nr:serine hydrolase domain-containing protein [Actinoplanes oblitus]WIM94424.1 serine hydrolase domain-containing protein [Actinoplanes oblitus]